MRPRLIHRSWLPPISPVEPMPSDGRLVDSAEFASEATRAAPTMPSWTDAAAYPRGEDLSRRAMGWEFLRRNDEYQFGWVHRDLQPAHWGLASEVDPQLSPCEPEVARRRAAKGFRARPEFYRLYWRLWDARSAGVTRASMAATLYPEKWEESEDAAIDAAKKDLEAAARLVGFNFRDLMASK